MLQIQVKSSYSGESLTAAKATDRATKKGGAKTGRYCRRTPVALTEKVHPEVGLIYGQGGVPWLGTEFFCVLGII